MTLFANLLLVVQQESTFWRLSSASTMLCEEPRVFERLQVWFGLDYSNRFCGRGCTQASRDGD